MRVRVIAVGTRMPEWVTLGIREYEKRLPREWRFEWVELPLGHRGKSQDVAKAVLSEGKSMMAAVGKGDRVVALDVQGKSWDTPEVASQLSDWQMTGQHLSLLIGGPDGLSADCLSESSQRWSLSPLTLPHPLVRIILVEQLYRAWSLLSNHPYHK